MANCNGVYSFDGKVCLTSCPQGFFPNGEEAIKKCKPCNLKISADGKSCGNDCGASEVFDNDLKKCVASSGSSGKIVSADGKSISNSCKRGEI